MPLRTTTIRGIKRLNIVGHACRFAFGEDHPLWARLLSGGTIAATGVLVAKIGGEIHVFHFHFIADYFGYALHGLGITPFIEWVLELERGEQTTSDLAFPPISDDAPT